MPASRLIAVGFLVIAFASAAPVGAADPVPKARPIPGTAAGRQPQLAISAEGHVFVAFGIGNTISCVRSLDGGQSFETPVTVGTAGVISLGMRRGPRISVAGKVVTISAVFGDAGKGSDGDLLCWRSTDEGATWSGPTRVNSIVGSAREGLHAMAASVEGTLFCTWLDLRNKRTELFGASSRDGGATWTDETHVYQSPERSICECCHPSAAFGPDGSLWVMWRNNLGGARDLYTAQSTDGGRTFGPGQKLGEASWKLNACPMDGGSIAVGPKGQVVTAWTRDGVVFEDRPGQPERRLGRGVQPCLAVGPEGTQILDLGKRPGPLQWFQPGASSPVRLADAANDPSMAAGPNGQGPVIAAWESGDGSGEIMTARLADPAPTP